MDLKDKTFLVTGGGSGLGAAGVDRLARAGAHVVTLDLQPPSDNNPSTSDSSVVFCRADVTREEDVLEALQLAAERFGSVHGVVQCAGILAAARVVGRDGPHALAMFRRVIEVNLIGTFNVMRLTAQHMLTNSPTADGECGVIINTASFSAFEGQIGQSAYAASKGGVASMTLPAARDLASHGIRVVAIAPGVFHTPMIDASPEKVQQSLRQQTVFPARLGEPHEFAMLVQHVIENPMLNGSVVRLDGAMRMGAR